VAGIQVPFFTLISVTLLAEGISSTGFDATARRPTVEWLNASQETKIRQIVTPFHKRMRVISALPSI
jgi:hypothetical protein